MFATYRELPKTWNNLEVNTWKWSAIANILNEQKNAHKHDNMHEYNEKAENLMNKYRWTDKNTESEHTDKYQRMKADNMKTWKTKQSRVTHEHRMETWEHHAKHANKWIIRCESSKLLTKRCKHSARDLETNHEAMQTYSTRARNNSQSNAIWYTAGFVQVELTGLKIFTAAAAPPPPPPWPATAPTAAPLLSLSNKW